MLQAVEISGFIEGRRLGRRMAVELVGLQEITLSLSSHKYYKLDSVVANAAHIIFLKMILDLSTGQFELCFLENVICIISLGLNLFTFFY